MAAVPKYKKLFKLFKTDIQPGINADDQVGFEYIQNTCIQSLLFYQNYRAFNLEKTVQELI